ncbi:unnamed protein product [Rhizophagus irregularis]|nr:unnamed protein product [Rhizophagus irregularis]
MNDDHAVKTANNVWDASLILSKFLEKQCNENKLDFKGRKTKPLDWENRKDYVPFLIDKGPWDFILAADVVWVDYLIVPLVDSIDELSTPSYTTLLLCHQSRTTRSEQYVI